MQSLDVPAVETRREEDSMSRPGVAAVLSFLIPGIGQFYNGAFLRGLFWLVITPGFWVGSGGVLGWICHIVAAMTAYKFAAERERRALPVWQD
jgi:TM2 domain-containing membrane protein YozV